MMGKIHLITESIKDLQNDFIGIFFNPEFFLIQTLFLFYVLMLFYVMFGVGRVVNRVFFEKHYDKRLSHFVSFALGYSLISTAIFVLGLFGHLTTNNVAILVTVLFVITIYSFLKWPINLSLRTVGKFNWIKFFSAIFLIIALLRLIPPQTAGDPLDYHLRFPRIYLDAHTIMIPALGDESYTTVPHLPELYYILTQIVSNGSMTHVIHFGFFVMIFFLLYKVNLFKLASSNIGPLSALMFASAPLMIQLGTQAFSDFPALLCFILSAEILLVSKLNKRNLILSGLLLGVALASKIWILYYYPFVVIFLYILLRKKPSVEKVKNISIFLASSMLVVLPWYFRAIVLVGNPFYVNTSQGQNTQTYSHIEMLIRNFTVAGFSEKFNLTFEYGVFIYLGIIVSFVLLKKLKIFQNKKYFLLLLLLILPVIFFPIGLGRGRYSLPYMLLSFQVAGFGLSYLLRTFIFRVAIIILFLCLALYYLMNTLIILPYGFGWANGDLFLRRNLAKDYASYYDFNGQFTRNINKNETVTNYGVYEMYYADFKYKNVFYFINQDTHIFLLPNEIKKLLVRGGDFKWMCEYLEIKNCSDYSVKLITKDLRTKQYLYNIKYDKSR